VRALAVLLTVLFHAWFVIPGIHDDTTAYDFAINYGRTGVQLFFVLSGFLLFQPYARWILAQGRRPSDRIFYLRRLRRIAPAYWTSLLVLVLLQPLTPQLVADAALHIVWLQNLSPTTAFTINTVYWTMSVEVQFYVVLPLCAVIMQAVARRWGILRAGTLICGGLIALSLVDATAASIWPDIATAPLVGSFVLGQVSLPYWIGVFACGIAASLIVEASGVCGRARFGSGALVAGVALVMVIVVPPLLHHVPGRDLLFGPAYAAILYAVLTLPWLTRVFAWKPLRFVGLISYSLYIWHYLVIRALQLSLGRAPGVPARVLLGIALGLAIGVPLAYLWYMIIERPFLVRKVGGRRSRAAPVSDEPALSTIGARVTSSAPSRARGRVL
jgi:peptidoglycan/LPS O-acetylase OafA/YrhL